MPDTKSNKPAAPSAEQVQEAEKLAASLVASVRTIAENIRYWAHPDQRPTCGVVVAPGDDPQGDADAMLWQMRDALAALSGAPSREIAAQAELLSLVNGAANICVPGPPMLERDPATGDERRINVRPLAPPKAVAFVLARATLASFSSDDAAIIRSPAGVKLLVEAVNIRIGQGTEGQADEKGVRWLEPLYRLALTLGLVGETQNPKSWSDTLRNRGLLKTRRSPPSRTTTRAKNKRSP